jgi:hypothetical protein
VETTEVDLFWLAEFGRHQRVCEVGNDPAGPDQRLCPRCQNALEAQMEQDHAKGYHAVAPGIYRRNCPHCRAEQTRLLQVGDAVRWTDGQGWSHPGTVTALRPETDKVVVHLGSRPAGPAAVVCSPRDLELAYDPAARMRRALGRQLDTWQRADD